MRNDIHLVACTVCPGQLAGCGTLVVNLAQGGSLMVCSPNKSAPPEDSNPNQPGRSRSLYPLSYGRRIPQRTLRYPQV